MRAGRTTSAVLGMLLLAGCSGDPAPTNTSAPPASSASDLPSSAAGTTAAGPADTSAAAETNPDPKLVNAALPGGATLTVTGDTFEPASVTIPAGTTVTLAAGDSALHGVVVGTMSSITVSKNVPEHYLFPGPGGYDVIDEITGAKATITVT
jgi:plastocyanin